MYQTESDQDNDTTPNSGSGASDLSAALDSVLGRMTVQDEPADQTRLQQEAVAERYWRHATMLRQLGRRYAACRLSNFAIADGPEGERQSAVVGRLRTYAENMRTELEAGNGILLFGPSGTGKDHLLVAMATAAIIRYGRDVRWASGMEFFGQVRDAMDSGESEHALISHYTRPEVLILSDPLPPFGDLTPHQAAMLYRVIDGRYRERRPTWVSLNVRDRAEAEKRMGVPIVDRLRDGALAMPCDWSSYRASQ